ncbi:uncharacterized protein FTOL_13721 [Fusarium torulosum]|uniref:Kinesin light chain n=1 Tax=Fusarium torulosum TaxID=33205 RepID=A0AAE8MNI3_9HYPO|nr:uncharacterized protein FTOL_13721 [Fusarium torulosum]
MLDEVHQDLPRHSNDTNAYTLGSIERHNIVIACLPVARYGTNNAANVLTHLIRTFPAIRLGLVVGIGGGVPSMVDVHLGDIVIGTKVMQYDLGKVVEDGQMQCTAVPKIPQQLLGTAVSSLRARHEGEGSRILSILREKFEGRPEYDRPSSLDYLFFSTYTHVSQIPGCDKCDHSKLMPRSRLKKDDPVIHYGAIASGNQVMRSGTQRDNIAQQLDAICFEMEAAGVMDILPCLPIRGICDYSDSHKNKEWQRYAAAVAAAYARELLNVLPMMEAPSKPVDAPNTFKSAQLPWQQYEFNFSTRTDQYSSHDHRRCSNMMDKTPCTPKNIDFEQHNQGNAKQFSQERHFIIPFGRNKEFVGRDSILLQLLELIPPSVDPDDCQRIAIEGLGGVGKTQIALEAVYRVRDKYPDCSVFWVPAVDATGFENAYRRIGRQLKVNGIEEDDADVRSLVKMALSESAYSWILIIDNADDPELLFGNAKAASFTKYLPFNRNGSIMFTTRNHQIAVRLDISPRNVFVIREMTRDESVRMLQQNMNDRQVSDVENANDLLDFLTDLPLAIKQASAYMDNTGISIARYLQHCRSSDKRLIELLSKDFEARGRYDHSTNAVATTWLISFEHISRDNKRAAEYLKFMCFLAEKEIPTSLLPSADKALEDDEIERDEAIGTLKAYAFISEHPESSLFDMHRLVRLAMRNWLKNEDKLEECFTPVIQRLAAVFPSPMHENRDTWLKYLPHGQVALELSEVVDDDEARSDLFFNIGMCLHLLGKYQQAEKMHRAGLELRRKAMGKEHPNTLISMNNLANVLQRQGRLWEAEQIHRQTLELRQKILGQKHIDTLASINNLALLLNNRRRYDEAERLYRQTLELRQGVLGNKHPDTLASMNNLALLLYSKERHKEAEQIYRQTLDLMEKIHGREHSNTLISVNNLANMLQRQGRFWEVEQMHRQILKLRQKILGQKHIDILASMNNLALSLNNRGRYDEAERLHRQTLELRQEVLGNEHPETLASMKNLYYALQHTSRSPSTIAENFGTGARHSYSYQPSQCTLSGLGYPGYDAGHYDLPQPSHQGYHYLHDPTTQDDSARSLPGSTCTSAAIPLASASALTQPLNTQHGGSRTPPSPPSKPQKFSHGAPNNSTFRYSNCSGRRKALLIGINYFGQLGQLRGCINDVRNMTAYLSEHVGYKLQDMVILTDDQQNPMSQPTKQNIRRAMHWLVKDAQPDDSLFFHYSGHGDETQDLNDEVIYPVDFRQTGHITDDEMHSIMVRPLQAGVRLTAIFDSCGSGVGLDTPYVYSTQGILKEPDLAKEASQRFLDVVSLYSQRDLGGGASSVFGLMREAANSNEVRERDRKTEASPADIIIWTGSKDDQTAADSTIGSQATGAMSRAFVTALKKNPQQSYTQLLNSIRAELAMGNTHKPQLSCSHPLDTNRSFFM